MPQCVVCGRPSRGEVHDGHCHDVYYGRLTTQRRKWQQIDTQDVRELLATAATQIAAYRRVSYLYSGNQSSVELGKGQGG